MTKGRILLVAFLCVVLAIAAFVGYVYWSLSRTYPNPLPPLVQSFSMTNNEFNQRIYERFPLGSSESALMQELRGEGFKETTQHPVPEFRAMQLLGSKFPCKLRWLVLWKADRSGNITDRLGMYGEVGCF